MYNSCAQLYSNSTQAPAIICWYLALCDVCLCYECSHNPKSAPAMPAQVPEPRAAPTHPLTSSSSLPNRGIPSPAPIYRHKQLTASPVAATYSAHTNKGSRYDLARGWCINTPVMFMRRQWRWILYACTPTMLKIEPRDVTVTPPSTLGHDSERWTGDAPLIRGSI